MNYLSSRRLSLGLAGNKPRVSSDLEPASRRHQPDYLLLVTTLVLLLLGLIVIYSIGPALSTKLGVDENHFMYRQLLYLVAGGAAFLITYNVPVRVWPKVQPYIVGLAVVSCLALLIPGIGTQIAGATRWISLGPLSFQPAELVKFALVLYLALFFTQRMRTDSLNDSSKTLYPFAIILCVVGVVIAILQKDLGTMITVLILMLTMVYFAGINKRNLAMIVVAIGMAGLLTIVIFPHRLSRISTFLHPNSSTDSSSYQINQALIAVGSGGFFGKGLGRSVQVYGYLPEAANDSIFAVLAEKFGFFGTTVVVTIFAALLWRLLRVVQLASNDYTRLLAAGFFGWVMAHVVVNIGAILGLLPLTGITLPFLSFGGTSLLFIMAGLGVVFNISRYTYHVLPVNEEERHAYSTSGRRLRWPRHATSSRS